MSRKSLPARTRKATLEAHALQQRQLAVTAASQAVDLAKLASNLSRLMPLQHSKAGRELLKHSVNVLRMAGIPRLAHLAEIEAELDADLAAAAAGRRAD